MRFAAIADIHGNTAALEAVLDDIFVQGISDIVNLGDHFSGPLDAAATAERLISLGATSILGNHDRWLLDLAPAEMGPSDRAAHAQLEPAHFDWLRSLPETLVYRRVAFLCHGTPTSDTTYWLERVAPDGAVSRAPIDEIEAIANGIDFPLILCAHTHIPRCVATRDGRLIVNPGSVGCPAYTDDLPVPHKVESGSPDACYAILEQTGTRWSVTHRRVPYDNESMADMAFAAGRPDWASALSTGWIR